MWARQLIMTCRRHHPNGIVWHHHQRTFSSSPSTNTSNTTSIRLYRILLRMTNGLNDSLPIQQPLDPRDYGQAQLSFITDAYSLDSKTEQVYKLFYEWHANDDSNQKVLDDWYCNVADLPPPEHYHENVSPSFMWTTKAQLQQAIRQAFRRAIIIPSTNTNPDSTLILSMQRLAMNAIQDVQQQSLLQSHSSVSVDTERGLRVLATSSCIGTSSTGMEEGIKYRFAYRIRVENLPSSSQTVQLLGRTWHIQDTTATGEAIGEPQHVHAPTTGAVGHLPVLQPGQVFEYMSGCELFTRHGTMSGTFHMAIVPSETRSGMVGDALPVFVAAESNPDVVFEMPIGEFPLSTANDESY